MKLNIIKMQMKIQQIDTKWNVVNNCCFTINLDEIFKTLFKYLTILTKYNWIFYLCKKIGIKLVIKINSLTGQTAKDELTTYIQMNY